MFRTISAATAAALTVAALVAPAGTAFAQSAVIDDAKSDTYKVGNWDDTTDQPVLTKSGKDVNADLDKVVVKHTDKRIQVTARYFSLAKNGMDPFAAASLKTDDGSRWAVYGGATKTSEGWKTGGSVYAEGEVTRRNPVRARGMVCEGFKVAIDWKKDTLVFSAPRACFGNPAWVVAHTEAAGSYYDEKDQYTQIYDNAHTRKGNMKGWTNRIKTG